jgi:putative phosphoesterase
LIRVGLISDTHGVLRPQALAQLRGVDHIVHAGDVGDAAILARLAELAPVTAVRGNNDHGAWAEALPETATLRAGGVAIHVIHDLKRLDVDAAAAGYDAVIAGHSHRPACTRRDGVLYVNPGSAGPRRFTLPIAVGELRIVDGKLHADIIELAS